MEFTELADYAIPAGTITEWIPSVGPHAATPALAGWQPDDRPTSYVHEAHLRHSHASPRRGSESWLGAAFEIDGPLDKPAFRRAVLAWIDRHESMRSHASIDEPSGQLSRVTAAKGAIDIWQVEQEPCAQSDEVFDHLQYLFDEYTSPLAWPAYAFVTLEPLEPTRPSGEHNRITVFFAADHSIIDGFSTALVAHEISVLYAEAKDGRPADLFEAGSYLDFGVSERRIHAELEHTHDAVVAWKEFLDDGDGEFPAFPLDIGQPNSPTLCLLHAGRRATASSRGSSRHWRLPARNCPAPRSSERSVPSTRATNHSGSLLSGGSSACVRSRSTSPMQTLSRRSSRRLRIRSTGPNLSREYPSTGCSRPSVPARRRASSSPSWTCGSRRWPITGTSGTRAHSAASTTTTTCTSGSTELRGDSTSPRDIRTPKPRPPTCISTSALCVEFSTRWSTQVAPPCPSTAFAATLLARRQSDRSLPISR